MNKQFLSIWHRLRHFRMFTIVFVIYFICINSFRPLLHDGEKTKYPKTSIVTQQAAINAARYFIDNHPQLKEKRINSGSPPTVQLHVQSELYGYLNKEQLLDEYKTKWSAFYPYEVLCVRLPTYTRDTYVEVDIHPQTNKVIGYSCTSVCDREQMSKKTMTLQRKKQLADQMLQALGYASSMFTLTSENNKDKLTYRNQIKMSGEHRLQIQFTFYHNMIASCKQVFSVPASYTARIVQEQHRAAQLTTIFRIILTVIFPIGAMACCFFARRYICYTRGIVPAILIFFIKWFELWNHSQLSIFSLIQLGKHLFDILTIWVVPVYFCFVAAEGIWRKHGSNLCPRATEPGYGHHLVHSMINGYLWAFFLLVIQSLVLSILINVINLWTTIEEAESVYNDVVPYLHPLSAWGAGISEEVIFRFFGIALFKKLFRNTFLACLLSSIIWGLGHTMYSYYPVIARPIELTIIGLLFSYLMIKHGFFSAVFAHVVLDSILMGRQLLQFPENVYVCVVAVFFWNILPSIVAIVAYLYHRKQKSFKAPPIAHL